MRFGAAVLFTLVAMVQAQGDPRAQTSEGEAHRLWLRSPHLVEPIFGIDYDPVLVRFEPVPERITRCAHIGEPVGQLFVFAHIKKSRDRVFLARWVASVLSGRPEYRAYRVRAG